MLKKFLSVFHNNVKPTNPISIDVLRFFLAAIALIGTLSFINLTYAQAAPSKNKHTPPVTYEQSAYRWFNNVNSTGAFGVNGIIDGATTSNTANATTTDSTYMYAVGDNASGNWRIEKRLLTTGVLVASFDGDGVVDGLAASQVANTIAIDGSSMYVAGYDDSSHWRIEKRSLTSGALDTSFDGDGVVDGATTSIVANTIAIDGSSMYVAGYDDSSHWRIEKRSLTSGALDTSFDGDGVVDGATTLGNAFAIAIDGSSMYVAGTGGNVDGIDWHIEKRSLTSGALDTGFDGDGIVDGAVSSYQANAIAIDGNSMYIVGDKTGSDWRIEKRSLTSGALDTGFDGDGIVDGTLISAAANDITIDSSSMYVAGYDDNFDWHIEKRSLTSGALDTDFDGDGFITGAAASNVVRAISKDSTSMYLAGYNTSLDFRIEKRSLTSGALAAGPDVGSPLAALNTVATAPAQGTPFRLRMDLHVGGNNLAISGQSFKLQFVGKGAGTCASPSGTPSSYTDVTTSTAIKYYDNSLSTDGDAFATNANDPTHSSDTLKRQTYEEANNFTNSVSALSLGEDGMWDFALTDNTASAGSSYCFRVVKADGSAIDTYTVYPELAIN